MCHGAVPTSWNFNAPSMPPVYVYVVPGMYLYLLCTISFLQTVPCDIVVTGLICKTAEKVSDHRVQRSCDLSNIGHPFVAGSGQMMLHCPAIILCLWLIKARSTLPILMPNPHVRCSDFTFALANLLFPFNCSKHN